MPHQQATAVAVGRVMLCSFTMNTTTVALNKRTLTPALLCNPKRVTSRPGNAFQFVRRKTLLPSSLWWTTRVISQQLVMFYWSITDLSGIKYSNRFDININITRCLYLMPEVGSYSGGGRLYECSAGIGQPETPAIYARTGTIRYTATTGCFLLCQAIAQAL